MISVNQGAARLVDEMVAQTETLGIEVFRLAHGTLVLDCGVNVTGGLVAGKYLAEVCMGGLGYVSFLPLQFGGGGAEPAFWLPGISVVVDRPAIGCMASQYAGWAIKREQYFAMGSGPGRALALTERELFEKLGYRDESERAVIVLESRQLPTDEVAAYIAGKCHVEPDKLSLLIAPTASLAGSVQVSARVVETGLHKLVGLGFDVRQVISSYGTAPVATVDKDDLHAIGRTNDCVLYGGQVYYTVRGDDGPLSDLIQKVPAVSSRDYGQPFYRIFKQYNGDFYAIDPLLFSPGQVTINNIASGKTYAAGYLSPAVLKTSLISG